MRCQFVSCVVTKGRRGAVVDRRLAHGAGLVDRIVRADGVQGAGVAVLAGGEVVLEHYAGDAGPGSPAGPETLWPVASISKLYTATMIMRLIEQGDLTLITRAGSVLARFDGGGKEQITLRHLLTHTSGLPYESPQMARLLAAQTHSRRSSTRLMRSRSTTRREPISATATSATRSPDGWRPSQCRTTSRVWSVSWCWSQPA